MNSAPPKILVVDDRSSNLIAMSKLLSHLKAKVLTAQSGNEALALCVEHDFAMILLDVQMPEMDGFEVAQILRNNKPTQALPILFLTAAHLEEKHILHGYQSGAVDYINKLVDTRILLSKVKIFLELYNRRREAELCTIKMQREISERKQAEKKHLRLLESQNAISMILKYALEPLTLSELMKRSLRQILNVSWFVVQNKGAMFLAKGEKKSLHLIANIGLDENTLGRCIHVSHGHCLCGRAAQSQEIVFADHVDERHDIRFPGMLDHGHYCVPILLEGQLMGVLNIYLEVGHVRTEEGDQFLNAVANTLAGVIDRHRLLDEAKTRTDELTIAYEQIKNSLDIAESASKYKSDFIANMSHEIRTPMNAIIGFTGLALQSELPPKLRDYLTKINSSSHSLHRIIDDVLDFSKIESGKMTLHPEPFSLHDLFDHLANLFSQQTADKGIELIFSPPWTGCMDGGEQLFGDAQRLEQVLINLIRNAVKFTERGTILVGASLGVPTNGRLGLKFSIQDTGIGIPEDRLPYLFDSFIQVDGSTTRKYGGSGLGLTICERLVGMMDGQIQVESQLGQGSLFSFTVMLECRETPTVSPLQLPKTLNNLKVLVVDDCDLAREIISKLLEVLGLFVSSVESGSSAVEEVLRSQVSETPYDLLFMDWKMEGQDGIESVMAIRDQLAISPSMPVPKVVLLTSFGCEKVRERAKELGIDGFLDKPVTRSQLLNAILEVFGEKTLEKYESFQEVDGLDRIKTIAKARILVVDDNPINQQVLQELLIVANLRVTIASSGREALEKLNQYTYDAVLMDVEMPEMDGYETALRIRRMPRLASLPIIACTAHAMAETKQKCLQVGMSDHLAKPILPNRLYALLVQWITPTHNHASFLQPKKVEGFPLFKIPGVDVEAGLQLVAGNHKLFRQLLVRFYEDQSQIDVAIEKALIDNDLEGAARLVHSVKGVAGTLGAKPLYQAAQRLERMILEGSNVMEAMKSFKEVLILLRTALKKLILEPSDSSRETGSIDKEKVLPLLKELVKHLEMNSIQTDSLVESLEELLGNSGVAAHFKDLKKQIRHYDFESALQVLDTLFKVLDASL